MLLKSLLLALSCLCCAPAAFGSVEHLAQSGPSRTSLVEVFTSEGCETCPAAGRWLAGFVDDPRLWKDYVPVAFHVDYWDKHGWKDVFAKPIHAERHLEYMENWAATKRYAPTVVLDGEEWTSWWRAQSMPEPPAGNRAGRLWIERRPTGHFVGKYRETGTEGGEYVLHAALLGIGVRSEVLAGDNKGQALDHHFIVLDYAYRRMRLSGKTFWNEVRLRSAVPAARRAVVMWVTRVEYPTPVQAAGTFLGDPAPLTKAAPGSP